MKGDEFYFEVPEPSPGKGSCDFCGSLEEDDWGKDYVCDPFSVPAPGPVQLTYGEDWWACTACAKLIDAGDWEALAQRAEQQVTPKLDRTFGRQVRAIHQGFARHRRPTQ